MKIKVKIPESADLLIKPGQKVDFKTPLARNASTRNVSIPLAQLMHFEPTTIFRHLKKLIGEEIRKGDVLAEHKTLLTTKKYLNEVPGILREIDHDTGSVILEQASDAFESICCFFTGEIDGIYDGFLDLTVEDSHLAALQEKVPYLGAQVFYPHTDLSAVSDEDIDGFCVFLPKVNPFDSVKMEALGARGLIVTTKNPNITTIRQIILRDIKDFSHVGEKQYPYILVGHEPKTVLFYR